MTTLSRRGTPIVISAPSGTGKTTLCRRLLTRMSDIQFSISSTTRAPRPREQAGRDYDFIDDETFSSHIQQNAFLEWATVHGRRYGTRRDFVEEALARGQDVLFDIDVQGGAQLKAALVDAVLVYIVPPSLSALAQRLQQRRSDAPEEIQRRLAVASQEIVAAQFYTHWIVNDVLETAQEDLVAIVRSERLKRVKREALLARILQTAPH